VPGGPSELSFEEQVERMRQLTGTIAFQEKGGSARSALGPLVELCQRQPVGRATPPGRCVSSAIRRAKLPWGAGGAQRQLEEKVALQEKVLDVTRGREQAARDAQARKR
jgi:hypothetical protein